MNYSPEAITDGILESYLPSFRGAFLEVGCGTCNYSFLKAHELGFKTYAVEPLWNKWLSDAVQISNTELYLGVISDTDGPRDLYLKRGGDINFASILTDWTDARVIRQTHSWRLDTFLKEKGIGHLACLKLDVEGSEVIILRQLTMENRPKIVVFEYGGGGERRNGVMGWSLESTANTFECVEILSRLGYKSIGRADGNAGVAEFDSALPFDALFPMNCHYGNVIAILEE